MHLNALGEATNAGGVLYRDAMWQVEHVTSPALPGWIVLKPLRHVEIVADLTTSEASQLGILAQRVAAALRAAIALLEVHVVSFAERETFARVRFRLIPRRQDEPPELRGPSVLERLRRAYDQSPNSVDVAEAIRICDAVRRQLATAPSPRDVARRSLGTLWSQPSETAAGPLDCDLPSAARNREIDTRRTRGTLAWGTAVRKGRD